MTDMVLSDSFDPRTWPGLVEPAAPVRVAAGRRRWPLIAGVAALVAMIAITLFVVLRLHHSVAPSAAAGATSPAAPAAPAAAPTPSGPVQSRRTVRVEGIDGLRGALVANGVAPADAAAATSAASDSLKHDGEVRAVITLEPAGAGWTLVRLEASNPDSSGAVVTPAGAGRFVGARVAANVSTRVIVRRGAMDEDSFYSSAVSAGISDSLIPVFAKALAFDFDFQREVHAGDAFEGAFEQQANASGDLVGTPTLVYASLTTATKSSSVYLFKPPGAAGPQWFDSSGRSIVRSLMRTPVDGARVSSTFGMREHPILGFMKLHKGVDFAVPIGTPIYAAGNAVIEVCKLSESAGNMIIMKHENGWETVYFHMNRFAPGMAAGVHVTQGQQIGEVGTTGHSTGPHLHYELHIGGQPVDPLKVDMGEGQTLSGAALVAFQHERDRIDVSRAAQAVH